MTHIMQGDACPIIFTITDENDVPVIAADVDTVEFCVGSLRKTSPDITYDGTTWSFRVSQQETLALQPGITPIQCRVKLLSGDVYGWRDCLMVDVDGSILQEVI